LVDYITWFILYFNCIGFSSTKMQIHHAKMIQVLIKYLVGTASLVVNYEWSKMITAHFALLNPDRPSTKK